METVERCNLCGAREAEEFMRGFDRFGLGTGEFQLVRCTSCGLIYLDPRPDLQDLPAYYAEDLPSFAGARPVRSHSLRALDRDHGIRNLCRAVPAPAQPPGQILDIGCGTGLFLASMRERGWHVAGIEPSPAMATFARQTLGLDIRQGRIEEVELPAAAYDVITLWHVLEHVQDPALTLRKVYRALRPSGWLLLTVPNLESPEARVFGRYWVGLDIPRHLFLFSAPVLRRYLQEAGLGVVDRHAITARHIGLSTSLQFWVAGWSQSPSVRRSAARLFHSLPFRLITWPYTRIMAGLNLTSFLTVYARSADGS